MNAGEQFGNLGAGRNADSLLPLESDEGKTSLRNNAATPSAVNV
jgi:hypothetical protein